MENERQITCPKCGAPTNSEICPYCGTKTGIDSASANMEYPVYDCKSCKLTFFSFWFVLIFSVAFGLGFIGCLIAVISGGPKFLLINVAAFGLISIASTVLLIRNVVRLSIVKSKGTIIKGTIYGYINSNYLINDEHAKTAKILINTTGGPRFILYDTKSVTPIYGINTEVAIKTYKNLFLIESFDNVTPI